MMMSDESYIELCQNREISKCHITRTMSPINRFHTPHEGRKLRSGKSLIAILVFDTTCICFESFGNFDRIELDFLKSSAKKSQA
jgi:hypothetical protein